MAEQAERLGEAPARESVGGEAGMHEGHATGEPLAAQVGIVLPELAAGKHTLVHDVACGKRAYIAVRSPSFDMLAYAVELALELRLFDEFVGGDEYLHYIRFGLGSLLSEAGGIDRDVSDIRQGTALPFNLGLHALYYGLAASLLFGKEYEAGAVAALLRHGYALKEYEFVRNLKHNAGSVPGLSVGTFRAAVHHILKYLEGIFDKFVGLVAADVHHHTDTAGIVFIRRVIESPANGQLVSHLISINDSA